MNPKTWLITGCSTGFGKTLTEELLNTDANVVATARDVTKLEHLGEIRDTGLLTLPLDVTHPESIQRAVEKAHEHFGHIDVLVNNAGYGLVGAVEECSPESIRRVFETNVFGLITVTQAVLPIMRSQKSGCIVNFSSIQGVLVSPGLSVYAATKHAVEGLSDGLSQELAHLGIKVIIVEPGPFRTDFAGRSLDTQSAISDYEKSVRPMRSRLSQINGTQPGDPIKAAKILIEMVNQDHPPLRLPLGNITIDRVKDKISKWAKEIEDIEATARSADY